MPHNIPQSVPAHGFATRLGDALGTVLILFCLVYVTPTVPRVAQAQQSPPGGGEEPLRVYTWNPPPSDTEHLQPLIWITPKSDPEAIAAQTLEMPDGQRGVLIWTEWMRGEEPLIGHPDDVLEGGFDSPWLDNGTQATKARFEPWIDAFSAAGGDIDIVIIDYETQVTNWTLDGQAHLEAIIAAPRADQLDAAMAPYDLADVLDDMSAGLAFNAETFTMRTQALEEAIFEPIWDHFPDAVGSNHNDMGIKESELAPLTWRTMQYHPLTGTHKTASIYGRDGKGEFAAYESVQVDVQRLRSMVRSGPAPLSAWVAYYSWDWEWDHSPVAETPYYKELICHIALHEPNRLLYWNPRPFGGDIPPDEMASDEDDRILDAIVTDINAQIGTAERTVITTEEIDYDDDLIVSGMQTDDEVQWRISTRTPGQAIDVFLSGQKIARLTPADGEAGVWYTSEAGDEVSFQPASGAPPADSAPDADFKWNADERSVQFTDASTDDDGVIVEWSWDFADGIMSTNQNPRHKYAAPGSYDVSLTVTDDDGATDTATKTVAVEEEGIALGNDDPPGEGLPRSLDAPLAQITIDADLQDWAGIPQVPITETNPSVDPPDSESDLSGSFLVAWDEAYLYVVARVTDDQHRISGGTALWEHDGIEILIDGLGNREPDYGPDDHQVLIRADGAVEAEGYEGGDAILAAGSQTADGYVVEAAVSWDFVGGNPPAADQDYGFNVNVNDRDHGQHEHQITWTYAPRHWDDTSEWGAVVLGPHEGGDGRTGETALYYGTLAVNQSDAGKWHRVSFDEPLVDPVVVMGPLSYHGQHPSTIRVRNVSGTGFEYQIDEWNYLDGWHTNETLAYLAVEAGQHALGALKVEAGLVEGIDEDFEAIDFDQDFNAAPVVLTQVVSTNGSHAVVSRQQHTTQHGFEVRLQAEEAARGGHVKERVAYVAIDAGSATVDGKRFVAGRADEGVNHEWQTIDFGRAVSRPVFLAGLQTYHGSNTGGLRYRALSGSGVEIKMDEEQSADAEVWHGPEEVGYLVFESMGTIDEEASSIELVSFNGVREGAAVVLHWQTMREMRSIRFEVQRRVAERPTWKTIGQAGIGVSPSYRFKDAHPPTGAGAIDYRLKGVDSEGTVIYSRSLKVGQYRPERVALRGNFPNPFRRRTTIRYELPEAMHVRLVIYNLLGQRVATLVDREQQPGQKEVPFDANTLASGVYVYRLQAGGAVYIQKMTVLK